MTQTLSPEGSIDPSSSPDDCTRPALAFIHQVLADSAVGLLSWQERLYELAEAFRATGAGLAALLDDAIVVQYHVGDDDQPARQWPWEQEPPLGMPTRGAMTALPVRGADERNYLLAIPFHQDGARWLFWLEAPAVRVWSPGECAALTLAATALTQFITAEGGDRWTNQARLQQRLEDMTHVVGRLSHDFGNVLTGIMGFTELSLTQLDPESTAFKWTQEVYEAAQQGVQLIGRLNQFSQRTPKQWRPVSLAAVAAEETSQLQAAWGPRITLNATIPADLPPVALDGTALRHLLAALLENARQAIPADGTVTLTAEPVKLDAWDCFDLLGRPTPGQAVLLTVSDTGSGFGLDAQLLGFTEPFFSSKPRHRGLGFLSVYGILRTYGGGLRLEPDRDGRTKVLVFLPVASAASPTGETEPATVRECGLSLNRR